MTQTEYAKRHGITQPAVSKAVREGRLETNGKKGKAYRVRGELPEPIKAQLPRRACAEYADLASAKLAKLNADTRLQNQKYKENQEAQWRMYAEATCEDYLAAFAPVSARLTEMRLPAAKLAALRKIITDCTEEFLRRQKARWEERETADA